MTISPLTKALREISWNLCLVMDNCPTNDTSLSDDEPDWQYIKNAIDSTNEALILDDIECKYVMTINVVAKMLADDIHKYVGDEQFNMIKEMNNTEKYADCCASNEFCDTNQFILGVFAKTGIIEANTSWSENDFAIMERVFNHCCKHYLS